MKKRILLRLGGQMMQRALLALAIAAVAATVSGCISVHTDKEVDHPVVVPEDHPNP